MYQFILFTGCVDDVLLPKTIGAYKCANSLRAAGYSCLVVDYIHTYTANELEELLTKVVGSNTLAVGFSTTFFRGVTPESFLPNGKEVESIMVNTIKRINENCKIILGGHKVFQFEQHKKVDYMLVGFSESSIVRLADHLHKQLPLKNSYRNIWGVVVIDDKEALDYKFNTDIFKWQDTDVVNAKTLPLEIARGCIFRCKFCSFPMNGRTNSELIKDPSVLAEELQTIYNKFKIDTFSVVDDTFNDDETKLDNILSAIKTLSFQPKFSVYARLDLIRTPAQVAKLYDIGVRSLYLGLETLNPETGKIIGKGYSSKKQIEMLRYINDTYGTDINLHGSFIIGLPKESISSIRTTYNMIVDGEIPLHSVEFNALRIDQITDVAWTSDISDNYEFFGYAESLDKTKRYINWQNNQMTFNEALALEKEFKTELDQNKNLKLSGSDIWSLLNFKIPLNYLTTTPHADINWFALNTMRDQYLVNYKSELNQLINSKRH